MPNNEAVVNPQKTRSSPDIGPVAVMAAAGADLYYLCELAGYAKNNYQRLFMSRLYYDRHDSQRYSIIGPFVGAPYAAMLLETLIAWGARRFIFIGWCGAVSDGVNIGDLVLPNAAFIDEGTSRHYGAGDQLLVPTRFPMMTGIRQAFEDRHWEFHEGAVWTTDAVYRETRRKVMTHRQNGILAVEMEFSALCSVARLRGVDLAAILVVSDELSTLKWRPGFKHERFVQSRKAVCRLVADMVSDANPFAAF